MTIGGIAENDIWKALKWGGAALLCFAAILLFTNPPKYGTTYAECRTDWDGRSNPEVCN
jgi:hypothetical protein